MNLLVLRKIISAFLVPPGLFILLILAALFLLGKRRRKPAVALLWLAVLLIFVLSSFTGTYILLRPLEKGYAPVSERALTEMAKDGEKTAVVVLAGDVTRGLQADKEADAQIGEGTLQRVFAGLLVYKAAGFPVCVSGGLEPGAEGEPLAKIMGKVLNRMGVPQNKIIYEGSSRTTWENAVYSVKLLKGMGFERVILVTDAVHMRRSTEAFRAQRINVVPSPSGYLYGKPGFTKWLPNSGSLDNNLRALHEWAGLVYYKIRY